MSIKNAGAYSSNDDSRIEALEKRLDRLEAENKKLRTRIEEIEQENEELRDQLDAQEERIDDDEQETEMHDHRLNALNDAILRIDEQLGNEGDNPTPEADKTTSSQPKTPIERLLDDPQTSGIQITSSVKRAMRIVANFEEWSEKTTSGRVVNRNLRRLLEGVGGEQLYWKQVHRAGEKVEQLTNGVVEFIKTDHNGWVLCLNKSNEGYLSRVVSAGNGG